MPYQHTRGWEKASGSEEVTPGLKPAKGTGGSCRHRREPSSPRGVAGTQLGWDAGVWGCGQMRGTTSRESWRCVGTQIRTEND